MNTLRKLFEDLVKQDNVQDEVNEALDEASGSDLKSQSKLAMIRGVLGLFNHTVADVRIPVGKVAWMRIGDSKEKMMAEIARSGHSRYPVLADEAEKVVGILHVKHLLRDRISDPDYHLDESLLQNAQRVPESKMLNSMLNDFQHDRVHMAIVVDEAGHTDGVVTLEDILEKIVGTIRDEFDAHEPDEDESEIQQAGKDHWLVDGDAPISTFNKQFKIKIEVKNADTVGGWFARKLRRIPKAGDTLTVSGYTLTVAKVDERRILRLDVRRPAAGKPND